MAFGLQGDRPSIDLEHAITDQRFGVGIVGIELWFLVFEDDLSIDDVPDDFVPEDFEFSRSH